jgi:hypothetical protein
VAGTECGKRGCAQYGSYGREARALGRPSPPGRSGGSGWTRPSGGRVTLDEIYTTAAKFEGSGRIPVSVRNKGEATLSPQGHCGLYVEVQQVSKAAQFRMSWCQFVSGIRDGLIFVKLLQALLVNTVPFP